MKSYWGTYGAAVLAALTGAGYLIGTASVSAFAETLGVTVQDLGINTRDYLAVAAVYGLAMVGFVALCVGVVLLVFGVLWPAADHDVRHEEDTSTAKWLSVGTVLKALAVLALAIVGVLGPLVTFVYVQEVLTGFPAHGPTVALLLFLVGALFVLSVSVVEATGVEATGGGVTHGWWRLGRLRVVLPSAPAWGAGIVLLLFVPITTTELAIRSGAVWADEILSASVGDAPSIPDERPWALRLLLQPALGHADGACVVRVSQTVVVSRGVASVRTIEAFQADGC